MQSTTTDATTVRTTTADRRRAMRILAKSIVKELSSQGYGEEQIIALATELLSEAASKVTAKGNPSTPD